MSRTASCYIGCAAGLLFGTVGTGQPVSLPSPPAGVQSSTSFGIQFSTIDRPGNRAPIASELVYGNPPHPETFGRVDHVFRMSRTEITNAQIFQFAQAWIPFSTYGRGTDANFGLGITWVGGDPLDPANYALNSSVANAPALLSISVAAIYCNWLHNNQAVTFDAFYSGTYDLRTWASGGAFQGLTRSPDARYWIPTLDEWTMGMYYDPSRYGPNLEGYWSYPDARTRMPLSGPPSVGETDTATGLHLPVGSYPGSVSPWGLLGGSGGEAEFVLDGSPFAYYERGSASTGGGFSDIIDASPALVGFSGLRIASQVPTPGLAAMATVAGLFSLCRGRAVRRNPHL